MQTVTLNVVAGVDEMMALIDLRTFGEPLSSASREFNPNVTRKLVGSCLTSTPRCCKIARANTMGNRRVLKGSWSYG